MNVKLLVITLGLFSASLQQTAVAACASNEWLTKFGFTATAPTPVAGGLCKGLYDVGGACVDSTALRNYLTSLSNAYALKATDASDMSNILSLQDNYFRAINNNQTELNKPISTGLGSIFDSIANTFKKVFSSVADFFSDLWKNASAWVLRVFNKTSGAINPCFQALNTLANGAFCALTSSNTLAKEAVTVGTNVFYRFQANQATTGAELLKCLPLVDNYCILTYGVSISDTANFNRVFNWADNGFAKQACLDLQTNYNCTTDACTATKHGILVNNFNTEYPNFVRTRQDNQALYNFLRQNTIQQPSAYVPINQAPTRGLTFSSIVAGENFQTLGTNAGITVPTYIAGTSTLTVPTKKAFLTSIITLFGLIVMLLK